MRRRFTSLAAVLGFVILLVLLIWQGSFRISYLPSSASETTLLWSVSTIIFLLTVLVGFMLFRAGVKVYIDRHRNKEGSRIRSKMLFGALALTLAPVLFSVLFSVFVLNRHLDTWFSTTALQRLNSLYQREAQERVEAETDWISLLPQTRLAAQTGQVDAELFKKIAGEHGIRQLVLHRTAGVPILLYQNFSKTDAALLHAASDVTDGGQKLGRIFVAAALNGDLSVAEGTFAQEVSRQRELQTGRRKFYQERYFQLICLIALFVLFFAAWSAQVLSKQIAIPISALLGGAHEVRRGNLSYRVRVNAIDELATLVRAFNEMTNELDRSARELEARRRYTEAILQSIPTGVISLTTDERIEHVNRASFGIFPAEVVARAKLLEDLFSGEDLAEIRYLLKRARRTGAAASQFDIQRPHSVLHLAVTVASLEEHRGFVMVLEDTSDLLRAQKAAAWQEVARRIAHEIKNPLTPISLSADRIARQITRLQLEPHARAILAECTQTIQQEVGTVKSLVDEFSRFSRFPSAQPVMGDLNEIVESALAVFAGRLEAVTLSVELDRSIPPVLADREQIKRVIVNLIDNAAEAMIEAPVRRLFVRTSQPGPELVQLAVIDTGCGISAEDKEKLFLPYFSTKGRGTGLGLAIVSHIVTEHHGRVRVEDNSPSGARFIVELNTVPVEAPVNSDEGVATLRV
ncbi:MAG: HAMP domain-containing protein [Acidobacteriaceae bacterium]|nr:HAMP domain-containing protein [Acidobacteriaceae bacterium]